MRAVFAALAGLSAVLINRQQASYGGTVSLLRSAVLETLIALLQKVAGVRSFIHTFLCRKAEANAKFLTP